MNMKMTMIAGALIAFISSSGSALAAGCGVCPLCDPPGSADKAARWSVQKISDRIDLLERTLVETIKRGVGQLSNNILTAATSNAKAIDAQTENQAIISTQQEEARVARDYAPSANSCQTVSAVRSASTGSVARDRIHQTMNAAGHQYASSAPGTPGAAGPSPAAKAAVQYHMSKYCSPAEASLGLCQLSQLPDADVRPGDTLLGKATLTTSAEQQAAADVINMLVNPLPLPAAPKDALNTPEGRRWWALLKSALAKLAAARDTMNGLAADRMPVADGQRMREIYQASGIPTTKPIPDVISMREMLELDVKRRYENPEWYKSLHGMEPAEMQRQQLHMQALELAILWRVLSRDEDRLTLNGIAVADQVHNSQAFQPPSAAPSGN